MVRRSGRRLPPAPRFLVCYYETTRRCDQGCPYCMTALPAPRERPELSTEEAKRLVLDEVKAICPQGAVSFSGGEVLLREDHLELIAHNAHSGLYSFVNTSGRGLDAAPCSGSKPRSMRSSRGCSHPSNLS